MRIMHISRAAETLRWFLLPTLLAQKRLGHYVCICTADTPDECIGWQETSDLECLRQGGFEVFTHGLKRNMNPLGILKCILKLKRILIEQRIDVIICHNLLGAGVGRIAARLAKTKNVIYLVHGLACAPAQGVVAWQLRYWAEKFLGFITDAVLVMNNYDEELCRTHHIIKDNDKIFRIPGMGVDLTQYSIEGSEEERHKLARELSIAEDQKIVLCVARLIPEKGVFVLLKAALKICAQRDDVCFLLAGGGPATDELRRIVSRNNLEANFKLLGWRNDIDRLMRAVDIFVLPSYYWEWLPVSILEAMACGKPVIATRHRGCEDAVVDGQTGFLVPIKQAPPLASKILSLLDNERLRTELGQAGRQQVEQYFELDYCTERIIEALEKAMH